jgi:hemolysin III
VAAALAGDSVLVTLAAVRGDSWQRAGATRLLSTALYVAAGWIMLIALRPPLAALDSWTFGRLLAGGLFYMLGVELYHRPALRYSHAAWHLFVVAGSVCHYVAVAAKVLQC